MTITPPNNDHDTPLSSRPASVSEGAAPARRVIRSDRLPDYRLGESAGTVSREQRPGRSGRPLRPARDAGLSIERRSARQARRSARVKRNRTLAIVIAAAAVLALGLGWRYTSDSRASDTLVAERSSARAMTVMRAAGDSPEPTPIFASRGKVVMRLPVPVSELTEVGFHQASYDYALPMKTPLPDADMKSAKKQKGTARDITAQETGPDAVLVGSVLRMWRDRPGKPNTAVDVGAAPGTPVFAPVEGTVVLVKSYELYGKHKDVQIHIRPDANPDIDCVMIHIKDPSVKAGDRVAAGVTRIGEVRKLSDRMRMQLISYTEDDGDHVHIQLNDVTDPDYEGLDGALTISGS